MAELHVSSQAHDQVRLLAAAWNASDSEVLERLLEAFRGAASATEPAAEVPIHVLYEGTRTEGVYEPASGQVTITTGELAGKSFKSPSGAALALVQVLNPNVHPNRNGWSFWTVTNSGQLLESIRPRSATRR